MKLDKNNKIHKVEKEAVKKVAHHEEKIVDKKSLKKIDILGKVVEKQKNNPRIDVRKFSPVVFIFAIMCAVVGFYFSRNLITSLTIFCVVFLLLFGYLLMRHRLVVLAQIKIMEDVFPDFIGLMASNLRAGMTVDRALLLSSRKEFAPLDEQIVLLGKDIVTGKDISRALEDMAKRINSEKITRTTRLIISGIKSGGNLAVLLEETAQNMRERNFVEKRAASNVLMYVIFIFFASAIGGPVLFGLSSILVEVMTQLVAGLPTEGASSSIPFAFTSVSISLNFIIYYSLIFIFVTTFLGSMVLGLVSKGKEREGLKYTIPMIALGIGIFLIARIFLSRYFSNLQFGVS